MIKMAKKIYDVRQEKLVNKIPEMDLDKLQKEFPDKPMEIRSDGYVIIETTESNAIVESKMSKSLK